MKYNCKYNLLFAVVSATTNLFPILDNIFPLHTGPHWVWCLVYVVGMLLYALRAAMVQAPRMSVMVNYFQFFRHSMSF